MARVRCPINGCGKLLAKSSLSRHVKNHPGVKKLIKQAEDVIEKSKRETQARPVLVSTMEVVLTPEETFEALKALASTEYRDPRKELTDRKLILGAIAILAAHAHQAIPSPERDE